MSSLATQQNAATTGVRPEGDSIPASSNAHQTPTFSDSDVNDLHDSTTIDLQQARERALLHAWRAGDRDALGELLEVHQPRLYAVCLGMTGDQDLALDLTQDVLVKVIQGLPAFAFRSRLSTWMTRIAINVCLSDRRRRRLRRTVSLHAPQNPSLSAPSTGADTPSSREPSPEEAVQKLDSFERLREALGSLEPQQRAILVLRDGQGFDYAEIASILEAPEGTVKSRLFRSRLALRKALEQSEGSTPLRTSQKD